jgi:hypothetical protein
MILLLVLLEFEWNKCPKKSRKKFAIFFSADQILIWLILLLLNSDRSREKHLWRASPFSRIMKRKKVLFWRCFMIFCALYIRSERRTDNEMNRLKFGGEKQNYEFFFLLPLDKRSIFVSRTAACLKLKCIPKLEVGASVFVLTCLFSHFFVLKNKATYFLSQRNQINRQTCLIFVF